MRHGTVTLDKVHDAKGLKRSLTGLPVTETVIIKPNWYSPHPGNYTTAETLDKVMSALDAEFIIAEGFSIDRQDGSMKFTVDGEEVNWNWLLRHHDWGWLMKEGRIDEMRRQEQWFLDSLGFTDVMNRHGASYVNVSEEIWGDRTLPTGEVKTRVEEKYPATRSPEVYGFMPEKLAAHRGSTLISLGRIKGYGGDLPSLSMKNLFGLIPDPLRARWHGRENVHLTDSIIDVVKLYASYFNLYGVCEALEACTVCDPEGEVKVPWGNYRVVHGGGLVVHGPSLVELDAVTCGLLAVEPSKVGYIEEARPALGDYDRDVVEAVRASRRDWLDVE